jgi:hypothetical protein
MKNKSKQNLRHFAIGFYWNEQEGYEDNDDNNVGFYVYHTEIHYGTEKYANALLKRAQENGSKEKYHIFWIDTERK